MEIGREMLAELRYRVLVARTADDAIEKAETTAGDIHLLVTDVVMPEMNVRDLSSRIASLKPGIKCLLMSGYAAKDIAHYGVTDNGMHFIQKPFSIQILATKIRNMLDEVS